MTTMVHTILDGRPHGEAYGLDDRLARTWVVMGKVAIAEAEESKPTQQQPTKDKHGQRNRHR